MFMETSPFLFILFLFAGELVSGGTAQLVHCNEADREVLLDFKMGLEDPMNQLFSWHGSNCCQWLGIACDNATGAVISINLSSLVLGGEIRPSFSKLKFLTHLDLSSNLFNCSIPDSFSFLEKLQYLNLASAGFSGAIPPTLGNLSSLQILDVSSYGLNVDNLDWVSGLVSLKYLSMNYVDLSKVGAEWVMALNKLPFLAELHLAGCGLSNFMYTLPSLNFTSLAVLDLACDFHFTCNHFHSKLPNWLANVSSLVSVDISHGSLRGRIPLGFSELPNLKSLKLNGNENLSASCSQLFHGSWEKIEFLDFSVNKLHGRLPASLGNMTSLFHLDLSHNDIKGEIPNSIGRLKNLTHLSLDYNLLHGLIPAAIGNLQHLAFLSLSSNKLNGTLPDSLGLLSELYFLDVSINELTSVITEAHFLMLSKLKSLFLYRNSLIFNISSNWVPPFQLHVLDIRSCHSGPSFPFWLRSQKEIRFLLLSNCSISGSIPNWFWSISGSFYHLDVSSNHLVGRLPKLLNVGLGAFMVDLSNNHLEGPIPLFDVSILDLSNNQFSGSIPNNIGQIMTSVEFLSLSGNQLNGAIPDSLGSIGYSLEVLDLSKNNLTGSIPLSIGNCFDLQIVDFQNNNLSGGIPSSMGKLFGLQILHLGKNSLSGEIHSLQSVSSLETLDLANNRFTGNIPPWIAEAFPHLRILSLRSNNFSGEIPLALFNMGSLQVLDLAENHLNGYIHANIGSLEAMTHQQNITNILFYGSFVEHQYKQYIDAMKNGIELQYTKTLALLTSIDLSGNDLHGVIPKEITKLVGLVVLNLSRNHISGQIPENISELSQLLSLDLSGNKLSGRIPLSMSSMTFLGSLNLSNNNLLGRIPYQGQMTTFSASSFVGNSGLCGNPLALKCPGDESNNSSYVGGKDEAEEGNGFIHKWFYFSIGLGFGVGLLLPFLIFAIKRTWGGVYFAYVDMVVVKLWSSRN
ncbi:receptor-like protein EIX2 [Manihot esculenta]|uniref:Uncharacterized protein n=1 Tax=Manihot esculenta TaxID=3983 RepID=A0ACB7H1H9_MANES|nr:receptor-like protein EIX2 [Manihot esculenta]KAG8646242.1 hypothetical protein MANES_10G136600v8 [Manihot esculenta]